MRRGNPPASSLSGRGSRSRDSATPLIVAALPAAAHFMPVVGAVAAEGYRGSIRKGIASDGKIQGTLHGLLHKGGLENTPLAHDSAFSTFPFASCGGSGKSTHPVFCRLWIGSSMVEQLTLNQLVEGSSPSRSTKFLCGSRGHWPLSIKGLHCTSAALLR